MYLQIIVTLRYPTISQHNITVFPPKNSTPPIIWQPLLNRDNTGIWQWIGTGCTCAQLECWTFASKNWTKLEHNCYFVLNFYRKHSTQKLKLMLNFMPTITANKCTSTNRVSCMRQVLVRFTGLRPVFSDKNWKKSCNDQVWYIL